MIELRGKKKVREPAGGTGQRYKGENRTLKNGAERKIRKKRHGVNIGKSGETRLNEQRIECKSGEPQ